jgi:cation diffusion facilitator family transporter
VLISSGKHLQSDTITTIGVVLSLILVYFTQIFWIDAAVALLFGSYIIFVGYKIVRKSLSGIMDEADPDLLSAVVEVLERDRKKEWIDIHNMKIQQYGSGLHIDAHITLPWYNNLRDSHQEMENIIKTLIAETERHVEFNFHMDDCKPHSCEICELECLHRQHSFKKKIEWTAESVSQVSKHCMKSNG